MKAILLLSGIFCVLLTGCNTTTPQALAWRNSSFQQATDNPKYDELLSEHNGWQIWRRVDKGDFTCIAVKPADGKTAPVLRDNYSMVTGDSGFFVATTRDTPDPRFSFYSEFSFSRESVAKIGDVLIYDIDNRDTVLAWDGQTIEYSISSQPTEFDYRQRQTQSGKLDFSGINEAYQRVVTCHRYST